MASEAAKGAMRNAKTDLSANSPNATRTSKAPGAIRTFGRAILTESGSYKLEKGEHHKWRREPQESAHVEVAQRYAIRSPQFVQQDGRDQVAAENEKNIHSDPAPRHGRMIGVSGKDKSYRDGAHAIKGRVVARFYLS